MGHYIHLCLRGFNNVLLGIIGLILVRVGSLGCDNVSSGSFGFAWVHLGATRDGRVNSCSRGITPARLAVVGFIQVR